MDLGPATIERLARIPSIIGIKDATGDLARPVTTALAAGSSFLQLSGHDATAVGFNLLGGRGCISVVANAVPRLCATLQNACREGSYQRAVALQQKLLPLITALERETNPAAIKFAVSLVRDGFDANLRLPLVAISAETAKAVRAGLQEVNASIDSSHVSCLSEVA